MTTDANDTTDTNDDRAAALIEALVPKLAEALIPQLTEKVEAQIKGVVSKNDVLLNKLVASKTSQSSVEEQLAALTKQIEAGPLQTTEVTIGKLDARDPAKYKAAKAKAEEAGVPLVIDRDA